MPATIEIRAERLLAALGGVVSARVVADDAGRIVEIHILATADLHPKQIVRNVESALSAGLGVLIDRRIVSVAQLRPNAHTQYGKPVRTSQLQARTVEPTAERLLYVQFDATSTSSLDTSCHVFLRRRTTDITGTATGVNTTQGRADTAARAVFHALQQNGESVGLEGTAIIETHGKSFIIVSARAVTGRSARILTGVAALGRSPEEAAILASLQAINRLATI